MPTATADANSSNEYAPKSHDAHCATNPSTKHWLASKDNTDQNVRASTATVAHGTPSQQ